MDFDLDDLVSTDAANNGKGAKFQPKAKAKPKPKSKPQPRPKSTPVVEAATVADNQHEEEQSRNNGNQVSGNYTGHGVSISEKSQGENSDVIHGLESFDDLHPESTTATDENTEKRLGDSDLRNDIDACQNFEDPAHPDPLTGTEATIVDYNGVLDMGNTTMGTEASESSHCMEPQDILSEPMTGPGPRISKFKPKPKAKTHKVDLNAVIPNQDEEEPTPLQEDIRPDPSETAFIDTVSDSCLNKEVINLSGPIPSVVDSAIPATDPEQDPNSTEGGNTEASNGAGPAPERSSKSRAKNQAGVRTAGRPRRRTSKTLELIDESEDEGLDDVLVLGDEDSDNNDRYEVENESLRETNTSASNEIDAKKKKPVRKRKKASKSPGDLNKAVKKKFPHRTRRNKRQVNPDLLKIPEDELDLQNVPMKELIRLAEHRERIAKKEASTSKTPAVNQSAVNFSNHYDVDEASAQGMGSAYDNENPEEKDDNTYYNYRTHMKITPRVKWSKQDTELFYEAIQQFGTDLSMVKECFPGRTRAQIKSKYKKEERQHPSRLHDALTTRAKGLSHFEFVIERLKQAQAQGSDKDEQIDLTGEEAEEMVDASINEETATKPEQLDREVQDMDPDVPAGGSPAKANESEDEMDLWSQYKSDL